jgi:hypothetical protein
VRKLSLILINLVVYGWYGQKLVLRKILNSLHFVCFILGNSSAFEVYMPTFRNTLSVPSSQTGSRVSNELVPKRRDIKFRLWELPKRKHTTFRTWRKFEIKPTFSFYLYYVIIFDFNIISL